MTGSKRISNAYCIILNLYTKQDLRLVWDDHNYVVRYDCHG